MDDDSLKATAKTGLKRRWQRRWAAPCRECGILCVYLDNTQPAVPGKKWSPWKIVEIFGERDGQPMFWDGSISFNPRVHVDHFPRCGYAKRRLSWIIRQSQDDL